MPSPDLPVTVEWPRGYRPRVVVRLASAGGGNLSDPLPLTELGDFRALAAGSSQALEERPLVSAVPLARLEELLAEAASRRSFSHGDMPDASRYRIVEGPTSRAELKELVRSLRRWNDVEYAYLDPPSIEPSTPPYPDDDPYSEQQGYLRSAPEGIGALPAWSGLEGSGGYGQHFIDLERGWTLDHEDLVEHGIKLLWGHNDPASRSHGTSVLGIVCAVDNDRGNIGISPEASHIGVVSYFESNRFDAIVKAIDELAPHGGVLLLEAQLLEWPGGPERKIPIEVLDLEYLAIWLATALGITVIEAAGNGGIDLDELQHDGRFILSRDKHGARDSGAVLVGAAKINPHDRYESSNYGSRIDCYAWGENVATLRSTSANPRNGYTGFFHGTSSASAIVAGAALSVQGVMSAHGGKRLDAYAMRDLLSDADLNTPSAQPESDRIGVMPDIFAIGSALTGEASGSVGIHQGAISRASEGHSPQLRRARSIIQPAQATRTEQMTGERAMKASKLMTSVDQQLANEMVDAETRNKVMHAIGNNFPKSVYLIAVSWLGGTTLLLSLGAMVLVYRNVPVDTLQGLWVVLGAAIGGLAGIFSKTD